MINNINNECHTFFFMSLDPIHIGSGGAQLGRVDNTIIRDPGTNLPKIPGSSFSGVIRYFASIAANQIECAGQGNENDQKSHCGNDDCPICTSFGFSKKEKSFQGMAQFYDASIVFFPVFSRIGPLWVTSPMALLGDLADTRIKTLNDVLSVSTENHEEYFLSVCSLVGDSINLGWLNLKKASTKDDAPGLQNILKPSIGNMPQIIKHRLIMVSDYIFSNVVNDNLEVRTSVAIDPKTGTAIDGALFSYEAIPRATILKLNITVNDPRLFNKNQFEKKDILETIKDGMSYIECFGMGGMTTRGMGRMKFFFGQEDKNA
ncbi:MAG TPA: type III-B CRISPR module RAMP protein Cmr4 [Caldisericia bacterium]|nr:type III-B CRISPR module RAMP protein Cmr4 [Caldisericia bacterium]